jgi:hypothetical protein
VDHEEVSPTELVEAAVERIEKHRIRPTISETRSGSRGGIVLPMITKGLQSINLVENSSGMCGVMLLLLGCGP